MIQKIEFNFQDTLQIQCKQNKDKTWELTTNNIIKNKSELIAPKLNEKNGIAIINYITKTFSNDINSRMTTSDKKLIPEGITILYNYMLSCIERKLTQLHQPKPKKKRATHKSVKLQKSRAGKGKPAK